MSSELRYSYSGSTSNSKKKAEVLGFLFWSVVVIIATVFATRAIIKGRQEEEEEKEEPGDGGGGGGGGDGGGGGGGDGGGGGGGDSGSGDNGGENETDAPEAESGKFSVTFWQGILFVQILASILIVVFKKKNKPVLLSLSLLAYIVSVNFQMVAIPNAIWDLIISLLMVFIGALFWYTRDQLKLIEKIVLILGVLSNLVFSLLVQGPLKDLVDVEPDIKATPFIAGFIFAAMSAETYYRVRRMGVFRFDESYDEFKQKSIIPEVDELSKRIKGYLEDIKPLEAISEEQGASREEINKGNLLDKLRMQLISDRDKLIKKIESAEKRETRREVFRKMLALVGDIAAIPEVPAIARTRKDTVVEPDAKK